MASDGRDGDCSALRLKFSIIVIMATEMTERQTIGECRLR